MGKAKKCGHARAIFEFGGRVFRKGLYQDGLGTPDFGYCDTVVGATCYACNARLPLGPSNDDGDAVRVEIQATETLDRWRTEQRDTKRLGWCRVDDRLGWGAHSLGEDPGDDGWIGWLVREMHQAGIHTSEQLNHDSGAWPWDPSRPLAGQYEEHLAAQSCPVDHGHVRSVAALADGIVEAGGTLPHPGTAVSDTVADAIAFPDHPLTAADYEAQRTAEPDCRDEDGPEVERLMAEPGPAMKRLLDHEAGEACRRVEAEDRAVALRRAQVQRDDDEDRRMRVIASATDPDDPTLIESDGPLPSAECLEEISNRRRIGSVPTLGGRITMEVTGYDPQLGPDHPDNRDPTLERNPPTAANCKLLGAARCEYDREDGEP